LGLAGGAAWFGPVSSAFKFMFSLPHLAAWMLSFGFILPAIWSLIKNKTWTTLSQVLSVRIYCKTTSMISITST
jgi:hypothetical protein